MPKQKWCVAAIACAVVLCTAWPGLAIADMRVAVMEFTNASSDPRLQSLGKGLQSMVTTDLAAVQMLKVVERQRLRDVQAELKLARDAGFDKATTARLGKMIGATHLFVGSYTVVGETMRLDGRLVGVGAGDVLLAAQIAGEQALFFELEQKLVQKIIAALGVKPQPKERAVLARPHTADFTAFTRFSEGLQAFDDGRMEQALKALKEATAIDKDFKLAALTLEEYERLAAQIRAKAAAVRTVDEEARQQEKHKALAAELSILGKLHQLLDAVKAQSPDDKLRRVALACILSHQYSSLHRRVSSRDLAEAGLDSFTRARTAEALFQRAWLEAPEVWPRLPPLCIGLDRDPVLTEDPALIEQAVASRLAAAAKLLKVEALVPLLDNAVRTAVDVLLMDWWLGELEIWEKLYAMVQQLPDLQDRHRMGLEARIAEGRRNTADFDGSTRMYAAASSRTQVPGKLDGYAREIEKNKALKQLIGTDARPWLRAFYLQSPTGHVWEVVAKQWNEARFKDELIQRREYDLKLIIGATPLWAVLKPRDCAYLATGPRSSRRQAAELRHEGFEPQAKDPWRKHPVVLSSADRGRRFSLRATVDFTRPADWIKGKSTCTRGRTSRSGEVGVAFALRRLDGLSEIRQGAPPVTTGYAVLIGDGRVRLVQITHEHKQDATYKIDTRTLADAALKPAGAGKQPLEVNVEPGKVTVSIGGRQASLTYKPDGDPEGFVGLAFDGVGYASIAQPTFQITKEDK